MKRFFIAALLVFALSTTGTQARTGTIDNPKQLPDSITISANRNATPLSEIASSITVISADKIERTKVQMVEQILRDVPGIDVVQNGGLGKTTSIFLRGANSHHTLVIIDGVKMNDPSSPNGSYDFSHLTTDNIQRIEILRGPQSVLYGSDAIGGVIQIFTNRGHGKPKFELSSKSGSYNTFMESVNLSGSHDKIDYSLALAQKNSDGFSATNNIDNNYENDSYRNTNLSGQIGFTTASNYEIILVSSYNDSKSDIDNSFGVLDDPNNISKSKTSKTSINIARINNSKLWNPSLTASYINTKLDSENKVDDDHPGELSAYSSKGKRIKINLKNRFELSTNLSSLIGFETDRESFESISSTVSPYYSSNDTVDQKDSDVYSLYLLNSYSPLENWYTTFGLRHDINDEIENVSTYRITSAYFIEKVGLKFKATYGTGFKKPSLFQLQHPTYGNPNLKAEESRGWELGFEKSHKNIGILFGAVYFSNNYDNLIDYNSETYQNENISEASSKGAELFISYKYQNFRLEADYTYSKAVNDLTDQLLIRRPKTKFNISASQEFTTRLNAGFKVSFVGERDDLDFISFPSKTVTMGSYELVDLNVNYTFNDRLELFGEITNLFDKEYTEVLTYNTSGLAAYGGLKLTF